MRITALCIGGPRHGTRIDVDEFQPEYRFPKKEKASTLEQAEASGVTVSFYVERYIRKQAVVGNMKHIVFAWEYATDAELVDLLTSALSGDTTGVAA